MDTPASRLAAMTARLRSAGLRISPQRRAILEVLAESPGHPSAEAVYRIVLPRFPDMSLATVYKTIAELKRHGEVLELQFSDRDNRYDGLCPVPHPHLICLGCGAIVDPSLPVLEGMAETLAATTGYLVTSHRLDFYGLCPVCREQGAKVKEPRNQDPDD